MHYPKLSQRGQTRAIIDTFAGYNHNLRILDGEFFETRNLTTQHYPLLANRNKRGRLNRQFTNLQAIIAKDALYWVDNGTLYANGYATGLTGLQTEHETQLVSMGAYICVFPDAKYINTQDLSDYGSMGASWSYTGAATYTMCHQDGSYYTDVTRSSTEPANPANGAIWIDISDGDTVKEWSVYTESWTVLETVYTRVDFLTMGQLATAFKEYDGVNIEGLYYDDLNGSKILYAVGGDPTTSYDYMVLVGICGEQYTQTGASISVDRRVPVMDYVCEAQNRLWGCFYGNIPGQGNINEIYCCALGDFRNWEQYLGLSTDSWRASRGSDGPWTGCINYLGTPTFFKEGVIHPVSVSSVGAHQIGDIPARGVQQGSHRSLAIVNETLYYKARTGIVAYQGGMPADVGAALGDEKYYSAVAGVFGQRYYVSMADAYNAWHFFCFDAGKGLWMHEDELHAEGFAQVGDELYALVENGVTAINGTDGVLENGFEWSATTGIMHYEQNVSGRGAQPVRFVSRYDIRVNMERDTDMQMFIEYDSSGLWSYAGDIHQMTGTITIPIRPRRCDHLRLKFVGRGNVRIFSIARVLGRGSDV
jgi:hypothetical protein